jgi:cytochrome o ubiquinol oxidase subunit 1
LGYLRLPVFCRTALANNLLVVAAFQFLIATFAMLLLDRSRAPLVLIAIVP